MIVFVNILRLISIILLRLALVGRLLEKKLKIRDGKKHHINFPYFLTGANRLNELFIKEELK